MRSSNHWPQCARLPAAGAVLLTAALVAGPATALQINMPNGGTSWIKVSSNACDEGNVANGGDCAAAPTSLASANYALEPGGSIIAAGTVQPERIALDVAVSGSTGGSGFLFGATGGNFTLHGPAAAPLTVTAMLDVSGSLDGDSPLTLTTATWRIGNWAFGAVASELNFRVSNIVSDGITCSFNSACAAVDTPFSDRLTLDLLVAPGASFNLGFFTSVTGFGAALGSTGAASIVGDISFSVAAGYFITGDNGFDSRVSNLPLPGAGAPLLLALGMLGRWARRSGARDKPVVSTGRGIVI